MTHRTFKAVLAASALLMSAGPVLAASYQIGDTSLTVDTTVSVGASMRASNQSCTNIGVPNGGCTSDTGFDFGTNDDDGNINFGPGDLVSAAAKVTTDFEARYENFGAFVRVKAFYDYINAEEAGQNTTKYGVRSRTDARRGDDFLNASDHDINLLDAFVFANFTVMDNLPLTVRLGKQVNNWGESLVIGGGINSYLSYDVSALRTPGAELKEAVLPQLSAYASLGLPYNFNLEGWVAFRHDEVILDSCGTFFSSTDTGCDGAAYVMNGLEYDAAADAAGLYEVPAYAGGLAGVLLNRAPDEDAADSGEFGIKLGYFADWLNDGTDIGLTFTNFHLKAPIGTFTSATTAPAGFENTGESCSSINAITFGGSDADSAATCLDATMVELILLDGASRKDYLLQYVEDVRMLGLSFNTSVDLLGGTALAGEIAYSPNMPFSISDPEINAMDLDKALAGQAYFAILGGAVTTISDLNTYLATQTATPLLSSYNSLVGDGETIPGYRRTSVVTAQLQTTSTLPASDPIVAATGADLLILLSNVGMQYLPDLDSIPNHFAIARSGDYHDDPIVDAYLGEGVGTYAQYADGFSWGYRLIAVLQYNNFMGTAFTVSPSVQWAHDVQGYSAGPVGPGFIEDKKTISIGASATYQSAYRAEITYTNSFGNTYRNSSADKDFASVNFSYAF